MFGTDENQPKALPIVSADILAAAAADQAGPAAEAGSGRAGTDRAGDQAPAGRVIDYTAELRDLGTFAGALMFPICPTLEKVYTPDVCARLLAVGVPLMEKYRIDLSMFGAELAAAIVVLPLVAPTIAAIQHDRAKAKGQHEKNPHQETAPRAPAAAAGAGNTEASAATSDLQRFPGLEAGSNDKGNPFTP